MSSRTWHNLWAAVEARLSRDIIDYRPLPIGSEPRRLDPKCLALWARAFKKRERAASRLVGGFRHSRGA